MIRLAKLFEYPAGACPGCFLADGDFLRAMVDYVADEDQRGAVAQFRRGAGGQGREGGEAAAFGR